MINYSNLRRIFFFAVFIAAGILLIPSSAKALALRNTSNNLGLVGYWSLNDGVGTKATDFSGNGNSGTLAGNLTWVAGKKGKAVEFNGNNEIVLPNNSQTNFAPSGQMTVSAWFKKTDVGQSNGIIYSNYNSVTNANFQLVIRDAAGDLLMQHNDNTATLRLNHGIAGSFKNKWYHIAFTNNNGFASLYLDGTEVASTTYTVAATTFDYTNIGRSAGGAYPFTGPIDDVRVYNRVLSATEIRNMYNDGQATIKARDNTGLVGYWSFEDGNGTRATDFSGKGNVGTLNGNTAWVAGKRGKALSFDGTGDYVDLGANSSIVPSTAISVSMWVKISGDGSGNSPNMFAGNQAGGAGWRIGYETSDNKIYFDLWDSGANNTEARTTAAVSNDTWYHVVGVYDGTATLRMYLNGISQTWVGGSNNGTLGASGVNPVLGGYANNPVTYNFNGLLDDVRIYNRALSATEAANLYYAGATTANPTIKTVSRNGLVGYWSLDDGAGSQATDFSGKSRTGTLTNMEADDWVTGKRGKALSFDGVDERIALPSNLFSSNVLTISLWAKFNVINSFQGLFSIYTDNSNQMEISVINSNASIYGGNYDNRAISATNAISVGPWYHIALTSNGSVTQLYVNGVPSGTTGTTNFSTFNLAAYIGTDGNGTEHPFNGLIDDVRLYSRALSLAEIQALYLIGQ